MANEVYRVIVSERAARMLVDSAAFLANVSEEAAERLVTSFEASTASLSENPRRAPWLNSAYIPGNIYRFLVFEKRYMLVYQIVDQTVYVEAVFDSRKDERWLFN